MRRVTLAVAILALGVMLAAPALWAEATLTQQPSKAAIIWKTYRNDQHGFSFEYPAVYDEAPHRDNCGVRTLTEQVDVRLGRIKTEVQLGLRIYLYILESTRSSLDDFVSRFIKEREGEDWILQIKEDISIHGVAGKKIEFRFGGMGRYGTVTFLKKNGRMFLFEFTAGGHCDFPEIGITEFEAYEHMIKTFRFQRRTDKSLR